MKLALVLYCYVMNKIFESLNKAKGMPLVARVALKSFCCINQPNGKVVCTNQQSHQRGGVVPDPVWVGLKWLVAFSRLPTTPGTFFAQTIFSPGYPLNDR